jgi:2-keto-4-pentenoate hydratase
MTISSRKGAVAARGRGAACVGHALDDLDALAADVEQCLKKGAAEYVKAL